MGIGDWGLGIWGLGIGDWPNPQYPKPNTHVNKVVRVVYYKISFDNKKFYKIKFEL